MTIESKPVVCFFTTSAGDWGGASRVLFTNLRLLDRQKLAPLLLLPGTGPIEAELRQRDLRYMVWGPLTEPGNHMAYARAFIRAWRLFRRERVSVIHVNSFDFWRPAELLAARFLGIPILVHYHVPNSSPSPAMSWCRAAISVSRYTAAESGPPGISKPVIYNPVSLKRFDAGHDTRRELGIAPDAIVVAFVGIIKEMKGISDFIAMARRIPGEAIRFLIAGECRDPRQFAGFYSEQDLRNLIGDDARIQYLGYVTAVENVYHSADIIVVPSRCQEALGLINLEAGACLKPIVATRVGGIPEVVHDGVNGYLVDPEDVDGLIERVGKLIADKGKRTAMGRAGRDLVERSFVTHPIREFETLLLSYARR